MKIKTLAIVMTVALTGCAQDGRNQSSASRMTASKSPTASTATQSGTTNAASSPLPQPGFSDSSSPSSDSLPANVDPALKARLNSCMLEAKQLARLRNGAYRASVDELYRNLRATQAYANLANELSSTTTELMTPLYQYRVNDSCNTISQLLLKELKKGSIITGS